MRGVQVQGDPRWIARSIVAAAEGLWVAQAGNAEQRKSQFPEGSARGEQDVVPPEELQEVLWKQFFADTAQWWDNRRTKPTSRHPDFRHKQSKVSLWLNNRRKPVWVDSQLAAMDFASKITSESGCSSSHGPGASTATESHVEALKCQKLCEDGLLTDAVDALDLLVQRGCQVPGSLFYRVIKRCIQAKDLALGRRIHALTVESGYEGNAYLATHLIVLYASHGSLEEAMGVFNKVSEPDAYNWATIISAYARQGVAAEAIRLYRRMCRSSTLQPDDRLFSAVLKACTAAKDVLAGQAVHAHILASSGKPGGFVQARLINMYAKCGRLEDARILVDLQSDRNVLAWTALIAGYVQHGMGEEALNLYRDMQQKGLIPDSVTYLCLLQACANIGAGALHEGKQLHAYIAKQGLEEDVVLGGSLVNMYSKCGNLEEARRLFDKLPEKSIVAWTAMIAGYAQHGMCEPALRLYTTLRQEGLTPDSITYVCLLQACANVGVGALHEGKQLHLQIIEQGLEEDAVLGSSLVNMYVKCGDLEGAHTLFDKLSEKNIVAWTALIAGYAQQGMGRKAFSVYNSMEREGLAPNSVTYVCLLQACAGVGVGALDAGKQLHAQIEARGLGKDEVLGGSLVNMYVKCGRLNDARTLFDKLVDRNVVAWTAMIGGYSQHGMGQEALNLYSAMRQKGLTPNSVTYVCLLQACATVGVDGVRDGMLLHTQLREQGLEQDVVLGSSLVNMYAKCGRLDAARSLFDQLPERSVVAWTAMVAGYAHQGMGQAALGLYRTMQLEGVMPNLVTYVCLLQACAGVADLFLGQQLHAKIEERGMQGDYLVGAALVNMYAKCGSMDDAQRVFDSLSERSGETWGALLSGYVQQGDSQVVFDLFERMTSEGIYPDGITFLSVLTVCSNVGLVDKGREYFKAMKTDYSISATMEHYVCMVDLLGRAGHLHEALQMAKDMPFSPSDVVWLTLLGACRKWKNVEIGKQAFECAVTVDEKNAAAYVLMSNIYASTQMWEAAKEMKAKRMKFGASKKPGQSWWTDMGGVVHTFSVGDKEHPESEGIYRRLEQLISIMKDVACLEVMVFGYIY